MKMCHRVDSHLKRTVEVPGEFDQLLLHRLADGTPVTVQGHAVHQQKTEGGEREKCQGLSCGKTHGAAAEMQHITSAYNEASQCYMEEN